MRWLMGLNAAGGLAATFFAAAVFTPSFAPIYTGIAMIIYFAGAAQPLFAHQLAIDTGFRAMESDYMDARRRDIGMGPTTEIITNDQPKPFFKKKPLKNRFAIAAFIFGSGLMIHDIIGWWNH